MGYGANLLLNNSAENGNLDDWTVKQVDAADCVTIEENTAPDYILRPIVDGRTQVFDRPELYGTGATGTHHFLLSSTCWMYQDVITSGTLSYRIEVVFQIPTPQDAWDASVKGWVDMIFTYDDGSVDIFRIPCVQGVTYTGRSIANLWLYAISDCPVDTDKTLVSIRVHAETSAFTGGLMIDYINLKEET